MRDRDTIHHELERAESDLESTLSELKDVVRHDVEPAVVAERAIEFAEHKVESVLRRAWDEFLALVRELRHTASTAGMRAALVEIWEILRAATRDLIGAQRHSAV